MVMCDKIMLTLILFANSIYKLREGQITLALTDKKANIYVSIILKLSMLKSKFFPYPSNCSSI